MPTLKSEFACPLCKRETGQSTQILATDGRLSCPANSNHRWVDTAAFYADGPEMEFKVPLTKFPPVDGQIEIPVKVPKRIKATLDQAFGERLHAEIANLLLLLSEGGVMVIGKVDLDRIIDKLGKKPRDSSEMYGIICATMAEVDEAKQERDSAVQDLKAYEGISKGRVVVDLGDQFEYATGRAKDDNLPLKLWIERALRNGLENSWF
jgi:hypothetical protein